jgi:hypothetical protein
MTRGHQVPCSRHRHVVAGGVALLLIGWVLSASACTVMRSQDGADPSATTAFEVRGDIGTSNASVSTRRPTTPSTDASSTRDTSVARRTVVDTDNDLGPGDADVTGSGGALDTAEVSSQAPLVDVETVEDAVLDAAGDSWDAAGAQADTSPSVGPDAPTTADPIWEVHWFYEIEVLDAETGQGVPGVQLQTTSVVTVETDANGRAAFFEPGLMDQKVWFYVTKDGYTHEPDGYGFKGVPLDVLEGGKGTAFVTRQTEFDDMNVYDTVASELLLGPVPAPWERFAIRVVDADTGRGVPLVELHGPTKTWVTDSAGRIAYHDLDAMGGEVIFQVGSHGYSGPGIGSFTSVWATPGGSVEVELSRDNVAERLYRITGQGAYRETFLLGLQAPVDAPLLNGKVTGQDTAYSTLYDGEIFTIWGDTNKPAYPLGLFRVSAATASLPRDGGLPTSVGVNHTYLTDEQGFSRPMAPKDEFPGAGPVWFDGPIAIDDTGTSTLVAPYGRYQGLVAQERGLAVYDTAAGAFTKVFTYDEGARVKAQGQPLRVVHDGVAWVYWTSYERIVRSRSDLASMWDPSTYEAWTCLASGAEGTVVRDAMGTPVYDFRTDALSVESAMVGAGVLDASETTTGLMQDRDKGKQVHVHQGRINWNPYRGRYVRIFLESWGESSMLGEIWYAESDTPMGPWAYATKIISHDGYSFYNPHHEPLFDEENGRVIYVEGTYTSTFAGDVTPTPRYDYNQVQYRLDLADARLVMPVPIYAVPSSGSALGLATKATLPSSVQSAAVAFFALDRPAIQAIGMYADQGGLTETPSGGAPPLFYCYATSGNTRVPLWRYTRPGQPDLYSTDETLEDGLYGIEAQPLCYVWPSPTDAEFPVGAYRAEEVGHDICDALSCPTGQGSCAWEAIAGCCIIDADCPGGACPAPGATCE